MRISDWSSDVCSSDLQRLSSGGRSETIRSTWSASFSGTHRSSESSRAMKSPVAAAIRSKRAAPPPPFSCRAISLDSEEHTSELQSLMRISYAVFCLKKQNNQHNAFKPIIDTHTKDHNTNII